jgi:hypothetical protein
LRRHPITPSSAPDDGRGRERDDGGEDEDGTPEAEEGTGNGQEEGGEDETNIDATDDPDEQEEIKDAESWDDVEEVLLATAEDTWVGEEPSVIEGEENPTLELVADREYEIGFVVRDEEEHNLTIQGDDAQHGSTQITDEEDEEVWQTIDATEELTEYLCSVHSETMVGEIEIVEDANGNDD